MRWRIVVIIYVIYPSRAIVLSFVAIYTHISTGWRDRQSDIRIIAIKNAPWILSETMAKRIKILVKKFNLVSSLKS